MSNNNAADNIIEEIQERHSSPPPPVLSQPSPIQSFCFPHNFLTSYLKCRVLPYVNHSILFCLTLKHHIRNYCILCLSLFHSLLSLQTPKSGKPSTPPRTSVPALALQLQPTVHLLLLLCLLPLLSEWMSAVTLARIQTCQGVSRVVQQQVAPLQTMGIMTCPACSDWLQMVRS